MAKLENLTNLAQLKALLEAQTAGQSRPINVEEMTAALNDRVKGQEHVTADVSRLIKLQWAKEKRKRPIANLLFVGKTGTGKTELAKAMAEYLYKDEKAMLQFDCGDLKTPESIVRLIGSPVGYVGSERGGELTRAVLNNPKRLILFDEVEKAHTQVLDVFLSMMGDGRLAEQGSGKVADFTQSIIILTSNEGADAVTKLQEEITDPHELTNAVKGQLVAGGKFRPEIAGRIDKVYVFKPLEGIVVAEIVVQKMSNVARQYGLELVYIDAHLIMTALDAGNKLKEFGIRALETAIGDMLGDHFIAAKEAGCKRVRLDIEDDGVMAISPAD
jgi:ATP-dependent Clp protease ATP-binding subunit ClpC